jgi:nicotinamidase-related amidase
MDASKSRINADETVILFADLQSGIVELTKTTPLDRLKGGVLALAKLARLFDMPVVVSGITGGDGRPAMVLPEIAEGLGNVPTHHRTTCDSLLNGEIRSAIEATGRRTLLISGVATELAVQLPALTASDLGYRVHLVVDAWLPWHNRASIAAIRVRPWRRRSAPTPHSIP